MGKRIISIILALIIMISMASSVFAYTNLNNTESINLTLNNANDYNVLPSDGKYKEPTNSFDDNVTNGYYLVTQDGTKS